MKNLPTYSTDPAARFYDQVNPDYRKWSPALHIHFGYFKKGLNPFDLEQMLEQLNKEVLELLRVPDEKEVRVLDAGCGVGATAIYLAGQKPKVRFTGVNISPGQVACGKDLIKQKGLENQLELMKMDFQKMKFPDQTFDAAYTIESACYADGKHKTKLINELYRVLKPGASLVLVDGLIRQDRQIPGFIKRLYQKNCSLWAIHELAVLPGFLHSMQRAGFKNIQSRDISWRAMPSALHIPKTLLKIYWNRFLHPGAKLTRHQKNYPKALLLTLLMGCFTWYFGYYLISAEK